MRRDRAAEAVFGSDGVPVDDPLARMVTDAETLVSDVERLGDDFTFRYPRLKVTVAFSHLSDHSDGFSGEATVTSDIHGVIHWARINLASLSARSQLVTKLSKIEQAPWQPILERACQYVTDELRRGEPVSLLEPQDIGTTTYIIDPILATAEPIVLFGDGGTGKSLVALAFALSAATGESLVPGFRVPASVPVLYLDYEWNRQAHGERLRGLMRGAEITSQGALYYRRMHRPIADDIRVLRAEVARLEIGLVVLDSFMASAGPDPSKEEACMRVFNALAHLAPAASFVVAHVTKKSLEEARGPSKPFGSVFVHNAARVTYELRQAANLGDESQKIIVGLYNEKNNRGQRQPPVGLSISFGNGAIFVRAADLGSEPDLRKRMTQPAQLVEVLKRGRQTVEALCNETAIPDNQVRTVLSRLARKDRVKRFDDDTWGLLVP